MLRLIRIASWPLVVKIPVLVAGLMVIVAITISQVVLWRVVHDQKSDLRLLTSAYLDGLSAAVLPAITRGDVWEAFDALDRARLTQHNRIESLFAVVELPNGMVLAASDPHRFPVQSAVPNEFRSRFAADDHLLIDAAGGSAWLARTLRAQGFSVGRLYAEFDIADLLRDRREILLTLVLVNGGLTLVFALGGYFVFKRMLQPDRSRPLQNAAEDHPADRGGERRDSAADPERHEPGGDHDLAANAVGEETERDL